MGQLRLKEIKSIIQGYYTAWKWTIRIKSGFYILI